MKYFQLVNEKGTILVDDEYKTLSRTRRIKISSPKVNTLYGYSLLDTDYFAVVEFDRGANSEFDIMITPSVVAGGGKFVYVAFKNIKGSAPSVYISIYSLGGNKHTHGEGLEVYANNGRLIFSSMELFSFNKRGEESGSCCGNTNFISKILVKGVKFVFGSALTSGETYVNTETAINKYVSTCSHTAGSYNASSGNNIGIYVQSSCIFPDFRGSANQVFAQRFHVKQTTSSVNLSTPKDMTFFNISSVSGGAKGVLSSTTSYSVETRTIIMPAQIPNPGGTPTMAPAPPTDRTTTISYNYGYISTYYHGFILDLPI